MAGHARTALDSTAKAYWEAYFGPYGKAWTRDVPRRVAMAVADGVKKAAATGGRAAPRIAKAKLAPLAWAPTITGGLEFEGVLRLTAADARGKTVVLHRAFSAEFDTLGKLVNLTQAAA